MMPVDENNDQDMGFQEVLDVTPDFAELLAEALGHQRSQTSTASNGIRECSGHVEIPSHIFNEDWNSLISVDLLKIPRDPFVASLFREPTHDSSSMVERQLSEFFHMTLVDGSKGSAETEPATGKPKSRKRSRGTTEAAPAPKKRKATSEGDEKEDTTKYVQMCRQFGHNFSPFDEAFLRSLMRSRFESEAHHWEAQLNSPRRASFIEEMCKNADILVKSLFCLLSFADFLKTPQGQELWVMRKENFEKSFQGSICRVLTDKDAHSEETFRRNPELLQSLYDSHACLSFLIEKKGMRLWRNLCFFLMIVSCIEGRGVYHGRTSNGLSMPHKCYRFMIEKLGGRDYQSETPKQLGQAGLELVATFERGIMGVQE